MPSRLTIPVPEDFQLAPAVVSYGYFVLAPNVWDKHHQIFERPLRDREGRLVQTRSRQDGRRIVIACGSALAAADQRSVKGQIARMLRLDEDLSAWFAMHPAAAAKGFGRLLRSPTLFEDIVKTITGCNVTWANTMMMNRLLCEQFGGGGFPTPEQLAGVEPDDLARQCKVGYRAERIVRLARDVTEGTLDLAWFEQPGRGSDELFDALRRIHGIGPYAAGNLLMLLGHYDRLAIDSETYRHWRQTRGVERPKNPATLDARIRAEYAAYAPFDFLAYWFELWHGYDWSDPARPVSS